MNPRRALLFSAAFAIIALPCTAGTQLTTEGRHIATGPKSVQQSVDGTDLNPIQHAPLQTRGRQLAERGRSFRAGPTQPVSVGIVGCPGCQTDALLEGLRPHIFVRARD